MNPTETSADTVLWSNMVKQDQNEPEDITVFTYEETGATKDLKMFLFLPTIVSGTQLVLQYVPVVPLLHLQKGYCVFYCITFNELIKSFNPTVYRDGESRVKFPIQ